MNHVLIICLFFITTLTNAEDSVTTKPINLRDSIDNAIYSANAQEARKLLHQGVLPSENAIKHCAQNIYMNQGSQQQRGEWWFLYQWIQGKREQTRLAAKPVWYQFL